MNKKIFYLIIANEFCERYCFYALKTILFTFLRTEYIWSKQKSTFIVHLFVSLCYLCTLIGGFLSDVVLGKYKTILYLSIVYFLGTMFLTYSSYVYNASYYMYTGLLLISFGTGGIKPCVAAFGGDQVKEKGTAKDLSKFFNFFYFSINLGSMLSTFFVPIIAEISCLNRNSCYPLAFGSSGLLLLTSIILFYLGSSNYIIKKANKKAIINEIKYLFYLIKEKTQQKEIKSTAMLHYNDAIKLKNHIMFLILLSCLFQSFSFGCCFRLNNNSVIFSKQVQIISSQMQTFNSIFILCFIPLFSYYLYPFLEYIGWKLTPIKKMGVGILLASISFVIAATVEQFIYKNSLIGKQISILWQLPQYILLTAGEIMLNMTGLEFAYSEAPEEMKTIIYQVGY
ncbi:solute carrier family 15 (oligopeptide transporter) member 1 [Vairimorpha apis BRL 01]|uniref:Solute carrier family 15 (Oligopeptide transporter) member 1 n=1 Tax=Vairimorpha apis BRL 01 TaxID=1037528 RepID=T0MEX7_9MICR|nr:solute carrier family 15 (oligopeptide transporter) member 1 [Vairimorpha apis BRL 01]